MQLSSESQPARARRLELPVLAMLAGTGFVVHWLLQPHDPPGSIGLYAGASTVGLVFGLVLLAVGTIGVLRRIGEAPPDRPHPFRLGLVLIFCASIVVRVIVLGYDDRADRIAAIKTGIVEVSGYDRRERIRQVVRDYVSARSRGDGEAACRLLTSAARAELVASLRGTSIGAADPNTCTKLVTEDDRRSVYTHPDLHAFEGQETGAQVRGGIEGLGTARVWVVAQPEVIIGLWRDGERWRIDDRSMQEFLFVRECAADGDAVNACACVFDRFHASFPGRPHELTTVIGSARTVPNPDPALLAGAERECAERPLDPDV